MVRSETPGIADLRGPAFELIDHLSYDEILPFAARYFFERTSWITRLHHALSALALIAVVATGFAREMSFTDAFLQFLLGFVIMFTAGLPIHEAVHAIAYRIAGAREIRWKMMWKYLAAYVVAERFVSTRKTFLFVALAPFVIITPSVILLAIVFPGWGLVWLTVLFWHTAGVSGDWALMNYYWLHRRRELFTWDENGRSYFYARRIAG